jgi:hypothetical protein
MHADKNDEADLMKRAHANLRRADKLLRHPPSQADRVVYQARCPLRRTQPLWNVAMADGTSAYPPYGCYKSSCISLHRRESACIGGSKSFFSVNAPTAFR